MLQTYWRQNKCS